MSERRAAFFDGVRSAGLTLMRRALLPALALALAPGPVFANPEGGTVAAGNATISGEGTSRVLVTQTSERALIDWERFSIGTGETTRFLQPGANALAANRVVGGDPSEILGTLEANGRVVLINRNGVLFGRGARVDTAGLLATVHDLDASTLLSGRTLRFDIPGAEGATVVNEGAVTVREAGLAALVAPRVRNRGTIRAGRVELAAARGFALDLHGDGLLRFAPGDALAVSPGEGALVESAGRIEADGGVVHLSALAAEAVVNASVNVSGVVRARRVSQSGGVIRLEGPGEVRVAEGARLDASGDAGGGMVRVEAGQYVNAGAVLAEGGAGAGGSIRIAGSRVGLGGRVSATGSSGGEVLVDAAGLLSLGGRVEARGTAGAGGEVRYLAGRVVETTGSVTDVSGTTDGGRIVVDARRQIASSGVYRASGRTGRGGFIDLGAADIRLLSASLEARGGHTGGLVRIGGSFRGGETPDRNAAEHEALVSRWGELPEMTPAREVFVSDGTEIDVSSAKGAGGAAVGWSQRRTTFLGSVDARGLARGAVVLSSAGELRHGLLSAVKVGGGHLVVAGGTVTEGNAQAMQGWSYAGVLGVAQTERAQATAQTSGGSADIDVTALETQDYFGASVSLNAAGDRLAVGTSLDDGAGNGTQWAGAVYLFTFSDDAFSGGQLAAVVGQGYAGGRNIDVTALGAGDHFGFSASLNGAGDRLAVGAYSDNGAGNGTRDAGAVYLFTFADGAFSGGRLAAVVGKGYTDGQNVDVAALETRDWFGVSVSLNAVGDRLAVGALRDAGAGNGTRDAGAVYLFTFTDGAFSGGQLAAVVGKGYTGGRNVDVAALEAGDRFSHSVSLNGSGAGLAVGASLDDGAGNGTSGAGAVYLFTFTDGAFSGGQLAAVLGKGYTGGRNVDVAALEADDVFGDSVSLNATGDRLAVGARLDDGAGNGTGGAGAVYLFTFTDGAFSGGQLAAVLGKGYAGGRNIDVAALEESESFGTSVSLNAAGDRLAVGASLDDGADNGTENAGAAYLFTFTDGAFSGGQLAGVVGKGYQAVEPSDPDVETGGVDVTALEAGDDFGGSVSLNGSGDRLAVGASGDDGAGNGTENAGAVYLFTFTDGGFSGGRLAAVVGKGYTGGRNVDVGALEESDWFGGSVSLNGSGDRLAVGASGDDGADNGTSWAGAAYLFSFTDSSFSGGRLTAVVGKGYTGGRNIDVAELEADDRFGSVSLNGAGDRLAVGAQHDDGAGNGTENAGAVYLFSFTDGGFSGGRLAAVVGKGYTGERNVDVTTLERDDFFGASVSLNGAGDRLAVGARGDAGASGTFSPGAVYLFTFTGDAFSEGLLAAVVGKGYAGGRNVDVTELGVVDHFGVSVSLNGAGDRLAVGAWQDDGADNQTYASGAVYLFTFTDSAFSGGQLAAVVGKGYTGGGNMDVPALEEGDIFGASVSLNGAGDRLAVGASLDDGVHNGTEHAGAVYLFSFTDSSFSGGRLAAVAGKGYAGGQGVGPSDPGAETGGLNVDVPALETDDVFGTSVSLNGTGTRLAVGAVGDDGAGNGTGNTGAVYLFRFTDSSFSGGRLAAVLGKGYTGGRNVDVPALETNDSFGSSVSLNGTGTRLAVGASLDDGADNGTTYAGAVYLFTFTDSSFSGGQLAAVLGKGYTGGRNIDVPALEAGGYFGGSVSLNGSGTRLAVGAVHDDGADNGDDVRRGGISVRLQRLVVFRRAAGGGAGQGLHGRAEHRRPRAGDQRRIRRLGIAERVGRPSRGRGV